MTKDRYLRILQQARLLLEALSEDKFETFLRGTVRRGFATLDAPAKRQVRYDGPFPPPPDDAEALKRVGRHWRPFLEERAASVMEHSFLLRTDLTGFFDSKLRRYAETLSVALTEFLGVDALDWVGVNWPGSRDAVTSPLRRAFASKVLPWDDTFGPRHDKLLIAVESAEDAFDAHQEGSLVASAEENAAQDERYVFCRDGDSWTIAFDGEQLTGLDRKGFHYIHYLLERPEEEIAPIDLKATVDGESREIVGVDSGLGETLDNRAIADFKRRLEEIAELSSSTKLEEEKALIEQELRAAHDIHGNIRRPGSSQDRARKSVSKAIRTALEFLGARGARKAQRHLDSSIALGSVISYRPSEPIRWRL